MTWLLAGVLLVTISILSDSMGPGLLTAFLAVCALIHHEEKSRP